MPTAEALASFLRHLAGRRGRSSRITSPETVRSYTSALPTAFAGITDLGELPGGLGSAGRDRLHTNIRTAWGRARRRRRSTPSEPPSPRHWPTSRPRNGSPTPPRCSPGSTASTSPKPGDGRVRPRGEIDRLITDKRRPLEDRTLWSMLYAAAARAEEVLRLDVEHLDRAATKAWDLHDLRHSRLTHAGEDGATEPDLMNLSGHEDRRTLQRYLKPSKDGTHHRLDKLDAQRRTWTPGADELAARMATR